MQRVLFNFILLGIIAFNFAHEYPNYDLLYIKDYLTSQFSGMNVKDKMNPKSFSLFPSFLKKEKQETLSPIPIKEIRRNGMDMTRFSNYNENGINTATDKAVPSHINRRFRDFNYKCAKPYHQNRDIYYPIFQRNYNMPSNPVKNMLPYQNAGELSDTIKPFKSTGERVKKVFGSSLSGNWPFDAGYRIVQKPYNIGGSDIYGLPVHHSPIVSAKPLSFNYQTSILNRQPNHYIITSFTNPNNYKTNLKNAKLKTNKVIKLPAYFNNRVKDGTGTPSKAANLSHSVKFANETAVNNNQGKTEDDIPKNTSNKVTNGTGAPINTPKLSDTVDVTNETANNNSQVQTKADIPKNINDRVTKGTGPPINASKLSDTVEVVNETAVTNCQVQTQDDITKNTSDKVTNGTGPPINTPNLSDTVEVANEAAVNNSQAQTKGDIPKNTNDRVINGTGPPISLPKLSDTVEVPNETAQTADDIPKKTSDLKKPVISSIYKEINQNNKSAEVEVANSGNQTTQVKGVDKADNEKDAEPIKLLPDKTIEDGFKGALELDTSTQEMTESATSITNAQEPLQENVELLVNSVESLKTNSTFDSDENDGDSDKELLANATSIKNNPDDIYVDNSKYIESSFDENSVRGDIPDTVV